MAGILNIETSTPLCSVALALDGQIVAQRETLEDKSHSALLTVFIEEILKERKLQVMDLDAVAVGKGPGSFTGLRIGVSTAKGLCYGSKLPLIAAGTLEILFTQALELVQAGIPGYDEEVLFCPMIDARRMEVFTCLFTSSGKVVENVSARIIDRDSYSDLLSSRRIIFFGSGMDKCRGALSHPNSLFLDDVYPHAAALAVMAEKAYHKREFENLAYFEPFYLKDFIATIPKRNLAF